MSRRFFSGIIFLSLSGCGTPYPVPTNYALPKTHSVYRPEPNEMQGPLEFVGPTKIVSAKISSSDYLLHMSIVQLRFDAGATNLSLLAPEIALLASYQAQDHRNITLQPSIILEYSLEGKDTHEFAVIPFSIAQPSTGYSGLDAIMHKLNNLPYTFYDVRVAVLTLPASNSTTGKNFNMHDLGVYCRDYLAERIKTAVPLAPFDASAYLSPSCAILQNTSYPGTRIYFCRKCTPCIGCRWRPWKR